MLKKFLIGLSILAGLAAPVYGAGTVPGFNLTPQFDTSAKVMPGCKLYVIQAGTTSTPQNSYSDSALTILNANPLLCDATGRLPQWFVADGQIKLRLTDKNGLQQFVGDNLLVIGASSGGGGGSPVDPTTVIATGDLKARYGTGSLMGFVRANGRTVGSASSGATERANADCQTLFEYLWGADANLSVSGGRGVSANADWVANKTIALPDWRGRTLAFLDDMGNSAAGRMTVSYFGASGTTLGASGGGESLTMAPGNIASHVHAVFINDPGHSHGGNTVASINGYTSPGGATAIVQAVNTGAIASSGTGMTISSALGGGTANQTASSGAAVPMRTVQPTMLATIYIKL